MKEITNEKEAAKYLNIPENDISCFYKYENENWGYIDKYGYDHLFKFINDKWIEISKNVKALCICIYTNGDWQYTDEFNYCHLMREVDGKYIELSKDIKAVDIWSYDNGYWEYYDEDGYCHLYNFINGKNIRLREKNKKQQQLYSNGSNN